MYRIYEIRSFLRILGELTAPKIRKKKTGLGATHRSGKWKWKNIATFKEFERKRNGCWRWRYTSSTLVWRWNIFKNLDYRELKDVKLEVPCCTWKPKNALEKITRRRQCRLLSSKFTIPRGINALVWIFSPFNWTKRKGLGLSLRFLFAAMHDRASANDAALNALFGILAPNLCDSPCFSYSFSNAGKKSCSLLSFWTRSHLCGYARVGMEGNNRKIPWVSLWYMQVFEIQASAWRIVSAVLNCGHLCAPLLSHPAWQQKLRQYDWYSGRCG